MKPPKAIKPLLQPLTIHHLKTPFQNKKQIRIFSHLHLATFEMYTTNYKMTCRNNNHIHTRPVMWYEKMEEVRKNTREVTFTTCIVQYMYSTHVYIYWCTLLLHLDWKWGPSRAASRSRWGVVRKKRSGVEVDGGGREMQGCHHQGCLVEETWSVY